MRMLSRVLLACAMVVGATGFAMAEVSTPTLKGTADDDGSVRMRWSFGGTVVRATSTIEIERSANGTDFALIERVARPRRRQAWIDHPPREADVAYRVRVVTPTETTPWSKTLEIGPASDGSDDDGSRDGDDGRPCDAGVVADVLAVVNAERAAIGLAALTADTALVRAAQKRASTVAAQGALSHDGWITAIREAGYTGAYIGENLAYGYTTPAGVVRAWMRSAGHRANILRLSYRHMGVACTTNRYGTMWWAQTFGG